MPTLRVLMLGKNRLLRIEGLEALPKLDVLDLHCNRIAALEVCRPMRTCRSSRRLTSYLLAD